MILLWREGLGRVTHCRLFYLAVLFTSATASGLFEGYSVNGGEVVKLLQFADDTMVIWKRSWKNLWVIKLIFRGFELLLGLKLNYFKSKVIGVNVEESVLEAASQFLCCKREKHPFKFLGIQVGINPRRCNA